jgi:uncharacterized membrane protein YvbJ
MRIQAGSFENQVMAQSKQAVPKVGMGATILMYTDQHACTIIDVSKSGKRIVVQKDNAKRIDDNGASEDQSYTFSPNANGSKHIFSLRKTGEWIEAKGCVHLYIGTRKHYHDYSF